MFFVVLFLFLRCISTCLGQFRLLKTEHSGASTIAQWVKNPPAMQKTPFWFLVGKIRYRRDRLPTPVLLGFPGGSAGKESACNVGDLGLIPTRTSWCVLSHFSCVWLFVTPWTVACQDPLSVEFSRQEYWRMDALLQGIFPTQGSNLHLLLLLHWWVGS